MSTVTSWSKSNKLQLLALNTPPPISIQFNFMSIQRKKTNKLIQSLMDTAQNTERLQSWAASNFYFIFIFGEKYDHGTARRSIPAKKDALIKQQTTSQMNK